MKIVMTGGHHTSALPVIQLLQKHNNIQIEWFGAINSLKGDKNKGLEYKEITALGITFHQLKAGKFYRTFDIKRLIRIPFGFFQALYLLTKVRADLIFSFGGYLAVPTVLAGWFLGIPCITHEQTVVSGWANKLISHFASKILITWPSSASFFPQDKTILTGIPLRPEIFKQTSNSFEINSQLPTVYLTGGKTGSHKLNMAVLEKMPEILSVCNLIHQCGDYSETNDFEKLQNKFSQIKTNTIGTYHLRKFVMSEEIGEAFGKASLVIARSGAHIVYDLAALKKPSLLIPIPWVSHNEQYKNAEVLKEAGIAEILEEKDLTPETLFMHTKEMLHNLSNYQKTKSFDFIKEDAAQLIVNEILKFRI
jgi:UDP-N-acetylglucosamine--N-acetylmuramyl-(pentapeptide) pyrophosphoryl-undecaprenol N-acetylglucosamine transferase